MNYEHPPKEEIANILHRSKRIAVVGLSDNPARTSYRVSAYMQQAGYEIIPVNPNADQILGMKSYPSLAEIEGEIDIVNVFRRSEYTPAVAEEAAQAGAKVLWLQLGIKHDQAYQIAQQAGLQVIMDKCIKVEHAQL